MGRRTNCISSLLLLQLQLQLQLLFLFAGFNANHAATSSTLLKRGTSAAAPAALQFVKDVVATERYIAKRATVSLRRQAFRKLFDPSSPRLTGSSARVATRLQAFVPSSANLATTTATVSGFKHFSIRATRLNLKLQKTFSLRTIFSNCLTNHPSDGPTDEHLHTAPASRVATVHARPLLSSLESIAVGTIAETCSGFVGGYALGAGTDVTRRIYRGAKHCFHSTAKPISIATAPGSAATMGNTNILPYSSLTKYSRQILQSHARSMTWAKEWARISAIFGTCRFLIQSVRHRDDSWNSVGGSAMAGAIFALKGTNGIGSTNLLLLPKAMTRSALLYGGTMFLLHPDLWKQGMEMLWLTPLRISKTTAALTKEEAPWYDHQLSMIN